MKELKVSVIMAVYDAEPYLRRCLDSLQAQTMADFDVILVDDGSTDRSLAISKEYASKDDRFRVYHKENGGVSSARQFGIERLAEHGGKYSIHVDPDDWVEPKMLEQLYKKAEETGADMVICDYYQNYKKWQRLRRQSPNSDGARDVLKALFHRLHGSLCNKMIRSACYKEAGIRFPEGLNYCEDFYVNVCLLLWSIKKVTYLPEAFYHYDNSANSEAETRNWEARHVDETRIEIVRLCRQVVPDDMKGWQFHVFEKNHAFGIIKHGCMDNNTFRKLFGNVPWSLLLRPGCQDLRTSLTLLAVHTPLGLEAVSGFYRNYVAVRHRIGKLFGVSKS